MLAKYASDFDKREKLSDSVAKDGNTLVDRDRP